MLKKNSFIIYIFLCVVLIVSHTGCSNKMQTIFIDLPKINNEFQKQIFIDSLPRYMSSDGKWIINDSYTYIGEDTAILNLATDYSNRQTINFSNGMRDNSNIGSLAPVFSGWSPDSTAFTYIKTISRSCLGQVMNIFSIKGNVLEQPIEYKVVEEDNLNCFFSLWSPDSKELAVYSTETDDDGHYKILFMNLNAEVTTRVDITGQKNSDVHLYWYANNIYITLYDSKNTYLYLLNPDRKETRFIYMGNNRFFIVGVNPGISLALLGYSIDVETTGFQVVDLESGVPLKSLSLNGVRHYSFQPLNYSMIATQIYNVKDDSMHLFYWYWSDMIYKDMGEIFCLISYRDDLRGFVVAKDKGDRNYYFQILKP
jgi:hypothetical protein